MILVYAIVPSGSVPSDAIEACAVADAGPIGAVYEERPEQPGTSTEELLRYAKVIRSIARTAPVLPVRYGTVLASLEDLQRIMDERGSSWRERLDEIGGCEELIVHIATNSIPEPAPAGSVSGTRYLMSRVQRHLHIDSLVEDLTLALGDSVRRSTVLSAADGLRIAFLVEPGAESVFRESIDSWADSLPGGDVQVTGPWPPFSFAATQEDWQ
jgi:hypothetical protein